MDENKQATLLLVCRFPGTQRAPHNPLTSVEYGRLALWLKEFGRFPRDLLVDPDAALREWVDPKGKISLDRLKYLLGRGVALGLALEKWTGAGIWIASRSDSAYPARLKSRLGQSCPPVLFGIGEQSLLGNGGLAIVGSRNLGEVDQANAAASGRQAAYEGLNVISGGAKGCDQIATEAALDAEGGAVSVLANDLFKAAIDYKWRTFLRSKQLLFISAESPEVPFSVGSAMGRNKYIYCLADAALIIRSDAGKGGTWAGAVENLRPTNQWVPTFVPSSPSCEGKSALIHRGAVSIDIPTSIDTSVEWLKRQIFKVDSEVVREAHRSPEPKAVTKSAAKGSELNGIEESSSLNKSDFDVFIEDLKSHLEAAQTLTFVEIKEKNSTLSKRCVRAWLDKGVELGYLSRPGRALIYSLPSQQKANLDLFSDLEKS